MKNILPLLSIFILIGCKKNLNSNLIYEGEKHRVKLTEELTYLENFIALNQMRYHKIVDIQFDVEVKNEKLKVMPLLFIILVENAFKHGVEKLREDAFVHINLKASITVNTYYPFFSRCYRSSNCSRKRIPHWRISKC